MLCARGGDSPHRRVGIRDRVGGERGIAGREPQVTQPPPTRVCAENKRTAAAAAAASAEDGSADVAGGGRDDCSAAPMSPWPSPAGQRQCTRSTFLAPCNYFMAKRSVGKGKSWRSGRIFYPPRPYELPVYTGQM